MCIQDIVETFCIQTLIPLKKASSAISCFTLVSIYIIIIVVLNIY